MSVVSIVAEYNPFHFGHKYHIEKARSLTKAKACVCVLSSSFVQRGEPGIVSKWARAKMALVSGADLVIELPTAFSCASAEYFSAGAISILEALGVVDYLCFGSEKGKVEPLEIAAHHLAFENTSFKKNLKEGLNEGLSFAASRQKALEAVLDGEKDTIDIINKPNNILGIEYIKALKKINSSIKPLTIKREGQNYNDSNHYKSNLQELDFSSASSIRNHIKQSNEASLNQQYPFLYDSLPDSCLKILLEEFELGRGPVYLESFENTILHLFRTMDVQSISKLPYIENGLENRLNNVALESVTIEEFISNAVTKRYPASRIKRIMISALTSLTHDFLENLKTNGYAQYIRVLGFNQIGRALLSNLKKKSSLPIITKPASYTKLENDLARQLFLHEIRSTDSYNLGFPNKNQRMGNTELTTSPLFV